MQKRSTPPDGVHVDIVRQLNALEHAEQHARIRALLPVIDHLVSVGVSHAAIVSTLANAGVPMTRGALRKALYRWRKRQAAEPARMPSPAISAPSPPVPALPTPTAATTGGGLMSKADLVRLRTSNDIDLNELAEIGRQK